MSWFAANNYCKSVGAKLVEINSEEENAAIVGEIERGGYKDRRMYFWLGLTDLDDERTWKLASNGEEADYLNWDTSYPQAPEPNNHGGNEHCAHMRTGPCTSWKDTWADLDCNTSLVTITCTDMGSRPVDYTKHALCEFGKQPCKFTSSPIDDNKETASTAGAK